MKKAIAVIVYAVCAILLLVAFAVLMPAYKKMKEKQSEIYELEKQLAEKKAEIQELKEELNGLDSNPDTVEKVAREKYNLCREGEIVYKYSNEEIAYTKQTSVQTPKR